MGGFGALEWGILVNIKHTMSIQRVWLARQRFDPSAAA